jgi:hypothetical protein
MIFPDVSVAWAFTLGAAVSCLFALGAISLILFRVWREARRSVVEEGELFEFLGEAKGKLDQYNERRLERMDEASSGPSDFGSELSGRPG